MSIKKFLSLVAERTHAMGFCLVNNVAVAAQLARTEWGCERVLVFDWCPPVQPPPLLSL